MDMQHILIIFLYILQDYIASVDGLSSSLCKANAFISYVIDWCLFHACRKQSTTI